MTGTAASDDRRRRDARTEPLPPPDSATYRETLRRVFGVIPNGVVAICGLVAGEPQALIASTFIPVSIDPPLVGFCVQTTSKTWPTLARATRLGVSVLAESQGLLARRLSARAEHRFAGLSPVISEDDAVFIEPASAWLECSFRQSIPAGDHEFVMLEVHATVVNPGHEPLIFHHSGFRSLHPSTRDPLSTEPSAWF
jgi:flavin reductase (DIM6/NTAB) family NADH-FMN oxidoreductase RutF